METINKRKKIFIRFLKENKCYKEYCKNYNNNSEFETFSYYSLDDLYKDNEDDMEYNVPNEISEAFSWDNSNENFEFWNNIDDEWILFFDNNIKLIE